MDFFYHWVWGNFLKIVCPILSIALLNSKEILKWYRFLRLLQGKRGLRSPFWSYITLPYSCLLNNFLSNKRLFLKVIIVLILILLYDSILSPRISFICSLTAIIEVVLIFDSLIFDILRLFLLLLSSQVIIKVYRTMLSCCLTKSFFIVKAVISRRRV